MFVDLKEGSTIDIISYALSKQYTDKQLQKLELGGTALTPESIVNTLGYTPADDVKVAVLTQEIEQLKGGGGSGDTTTTVTDTGAVVAIDAVEGSDIQIQSDAAKSVTLVHQGKNFLPMNDPEKTTNGITFTPNEDGTLTIKGLSTDGAKYAFAAYDSPIYFPAGKYMFSTNMLPGKHLNFSLKGKGGIILITGAIKPNYAFELAEAAMIYSSVEMTQEGVEMDGTYWFMVERADAPSAFEPYHAEVIETELPTTIAAHAGTNVLYTQSADVLTVSAIAKNQESSSDSNKTGTDVVLTEAQIISCKEYAERINAATGKTENFVFFTDPHFGGSTKLSANTENHLRQIAEIYNHTPTSMCVCGGDWLNNSNTKENACWQLGVFDGQMKALFDRYVMIIGNHDTNYQGKEYIESGADGTYDRETHEQCILPRNALVNLWHRKHGASYFVEDGDCTKFYVFDTGLDWYSDMDAYRWEQVDWFANDLLSTKPERSAALLHIAGASAMDTTPFISNITQIAKAYNTRSSVTLNGKTYNYSGVTGKFHFILGGHKHRDLTYILNDVVVIVTTRLHETAGIVTFDLVMVDYDAEKIHMVRVGSGSNRTISLVDGSVIED